MMKNRILLPFVFACLTSLVGCVSGDEPVSFEEQLAIDVQKIEAFLDEKGINAQEDDSGIRYVIDEQGNGAAIEDEDVIAVKYVVKDMRNEVTVGADTVGLVITVNPNLIAAWRIMLPKLNVGGKMTFYCPSVYAFGSSGNGQNVGPDANLIYEIEVLGKVTDNVTQLDIEGAIIDEYLAENGISAQVDSSGIRYQELQVAAGPSPTLDNSVRVVYEGRLLNVASGFLFDQSPDEGAIFSLKGLIQAWQIMIPKMNQGEKIKIFTPSIYAYGEQGTNTIAPNAILIFEIELLEVR